MKIQSIGNQQSFTASACFVPPRAPLNLRRLISTERIVDSLRNFSDLPLGERKETDFLKKLDLGKPLDAEDIIENLQLAVKRGVIRRSSQVIVPPRYYTEARAFELNGDTLVLYSKPNHYDHSVGASAKIAIEHVEDGHDKGTTHIFRKYPERKDPEFDAIEKALNDLPE